MSTNSRRSTQKRLSWGRTCAVFTAALLAMAASTARAATASPTTLAPMPANKDSTLVTNNGGEITGTTFASMIAATIGSNASNSNVKDAKFMFQECYGGGMLQDLQNALGAADNATSLSWVGGAASQWDEPSLGYDSIPGDTWTQALVPQLKIGAQTLLTDFNNTMAGAGRDSLSPPGVTVNGKTYVEHPQSYYGDSGNSIKLQDNATSHHAILWAGNPDGTRHFADVQNMYNQLVTTWGNPATNPNISITVLYGDGVNQLNGKAASGKLPAAWGALPATQANLQATLNTLKNELGPNEQFLFYASDHGGTTDKMQPAPVAIPAQNTDTESLQLDQSELVGIDDGGDGTCTLEVTYDTLSVNSADHDPVKVDGALLGYLDPSLGTADDPITGETTQDFSIPDADVTAGGDEVDITDEDAALPIELDGKTFDSGEDDTLNVDDLPEPASICLLGIAGTMLLTRRRSA